MKKTILNILLCGFLLLGLTGCGKPIADKASLEKINNKIIEYFSSDKVEYDNLSFNYVDVTNGKVVVGLIDNSKEQQEKFKELVVDSNLIEFIHGEYIQQTNK